MQFKSDLPRAALLRCWVLLLVGYTLSGCDSAPGPADALERPPVVSSFSYAPKQLNLVDVAPGELEDGTIEVAFTASAAVDTRGGAVSLDRVIFVLRPPTQNAAPVAFERMETAGNDLYEINQTLTLDAGEVGNYTMSIYAVDANGQLSNQVLGTFQLINEGSPPVIDSLVVPDTIVRPTTGEKEELFIAVVSDPDGLNNIAGVVFWNVARPDITFSLFDDGESSGDETAGDGRYTTTVVIGSGNAAGINRFAFQATDRAGLKSEVVVKEITIQ